MKKNLIISLVISVYALAACSNSTGIVGTWGYGYTQNGDDLYFEELDSGTFEDTKLVFDKDNKLAFSSRRGEENGTWESVPTASNDANKYEITIKNDISYVYQDKQKQDEIYLIDSLNGSEVKMVFVKNENQITDTKYQTASNAMSEGEYERASEILESISGYKDSDKLLEESNNMIVYNEAVKLFNEEQYEGAKTKFESLGDFKDSRENANKVVEAQEAAEYNEAVEAFRDNEFDRAKALFELLGDYKDSQDYYNKIDDAKLEYTYKQAVKEFDEGAYDSALVRFKGLGDYQDSKEYIVKTEEAISENTYNIAFSKALSGNYSEAIELFETLGDFKDSQQQLLEAKYNNAIKLAESRYVLEAIEIFKEIGGYKDSDHRCTCAQQLHDIKQEYAEAEDETAQDILSVLRQYADNSDFVMSREERYRIKAVTTLYGEWAYSKGENKSLSRAFGSDSIRIVPILFYDDVEEDRESVLGIAIFSGERLITTTDLIMSETYVRLSNSFDMEFDQNSLYIKQMTGKDSPEVMYSKHSN